MYYYELHRLGSIGGNIMKKANSKQQIKTLVLGAIFTALVIVLQFMGAFIRFGTFQVSLVLVPIVLPYESEWTVVVLPKISVLEVE